MQREVTVAGRKHGEKRIMLERVYDNVLIQSSCYYYIGKINHHFMSMVITVIRYDTSQHLTTLHKLTLHH